MQINCSSTLEIVDSFESQDGLENGLELGHLFFAVERHEFPRDWARRPAKKSPTIARS